MIQKVLQVLRCIMIQKVLQVLRCIMIKKVLQELRCIKIKKVLQVLRCIMTQKVLQVHTPFAFTVYSTHNIMKYQIIDLPWIILLDHHVIKGS